MANKRVIWIDIIKIFSLIYIVIEHFIQSMQKSGFIADTTFWLWIDSICACVMVQLFFLCSGFLYQKQCHISCAKEWLQQIKKKMFYLGLPYFFFSIVTISAKMIMPNSVNEAVDQSLLHLLFIEPIPPYWFLYILFILFAITLPLNNVKLKKVTIITSVALYLVYLLMPLPYILSQVCRYELWFVIGMVLADEDLTDLLPKWVKYVLLLYIPISYFVLVNHLTTQITVTILGLAAGLLIILWAKTLGDKISPEHRVYEWIIKLTKYIMPIFLMQTIFAAGFRIVLLKLGITTAWMHILGGIMITFVGPSVAAMIYWRIMKKIKEFKIDKQRL